MFSTIARKRLLKTKAFLLSLITFVPKIYAAPHMPWDDSLMVVQQALTGTTAHIIIIIAIALSGLMWAIGDQGSIIQKAGKIIFGGTIATGAVSICTALKLVGDGY
jgi:type IV secretory pathway VirB2 component (pilin)